MLALVSSPPLPSPFPSGLPPITHLGEHPLLSCLSLSSPPNSPLLTHTLPGKSCCQTVLLRLLLHSPGWWSPLPASSCDPYSACPPLWYFLGNYWTPANYFIWRFGSTEYYCLLHPILDDNLPFFFGGHNILPALASISCSGSCVVGLALVGTGLQAPHGLLRLAS